MTEILDEGAIDKIAARTLTGHYPDLDQVSALCATVKHLRGELSTTKGYLADTTEDLASALLMRDEMQSQLEHQRDENKSLLNQLTAANAEIVQVEQERDRSETEIRTEERKAVWDEAIRRASAVRGRFQQLGGAFKRDGMAEAEERNASGIEAADRIVRALGRGRGATENRKEEG